MPDARRLYRATLIAVATLALAPAPAPAAERKAPPAATKKVPTEDELNAVKAILKNADLLVACEKGDVVKVKKLLSEGVDPNASRSSGATALSYAVAGRHTAVARALLDAKADPNRSSFGLYPLFLAAENGDVDTVKVLLKAGATVDAPLEAVDEEMKVRNGDTALMASASAKPGAATARTLLAAGANVDARADNGKTAVMQAVASENIDVLKVLLEKKPDLDAMMDPPEAIDALSLAVGKSRADMVAMLIAAGANVNVKIDGEVTLLEFAILSEQPQVASMLRKAGVDEPSADRLAALRKAAAEP